MARLTPVLVETGASHQPIDPADRFQDEKGSRAAAGARRKVAKLDFRSLFFLKSM
jgi:hypothetical protein